MFDRFLSMPHIFLVSNLYFTINYKLNFYTGMVPATLFRPGIFFRSKYVLKLLNGLDITSFKNMLVKMKCSFPCRNISLINIAIHF